MGVKLAFQSKEKEEGRTSSVSTTVPKAAVRIVEGKNVVWVVNKGRAERRAVTVGDTMADRTTIAAGLNGGERIVIEGADNLVENASVTEAKP